MENAFRKAVTKISKETAFVLLTAASAVVLPKILHGVGAALGVGGQLGQIFLPMYLPVLILGFYRGVIPGAVVGLLAPLVSFGLTGMPAQALLPYVTVELSATGALAGVFARSRMHGVLRVLSVQIAAKAIRLLVYAIALYAARGTVVPSALFAGIPASLPGVLLQLALVGFLLEKKAHASK